MGEPSAQSERRFGRYRVIGELGAGAMAKVYRARDDSLGRDVAIKVVQTAYLGELAAEQFRARFATEARVVAQLSHPNIVPVYDVGVEDGMPYLVMELAAGESLKQRIERAPLSPGEVRTLGIQMAGALAAAHERGVIHRDVKPANLLEFEPGVWKLADFGVAHAPESEMTLTGQFIGSPAYAAPEALSSGEMSPASDVFGLGATLWTALVGSAPYADRKTGAFGAGGPPNLMALRVDVPPPLAGAITAALAIDPAARPDAAGMARSLAAPASAPSPVDVVRPPTTATIAATDPRKRQRLLVAGIGGALLLVLIIALAASGSGPDRPPPQWQPAGAPAVAGGGGTDDPVTVGNYPRDRKNADRMKKALEKIDDGDYREAAKKLGDILRDDPNDYEARALYDRVAPYAADDEPPGHRGRGRKHRH